jgi:iron complex outermembrane receptor protein
MDWVLTFFRAAPQLADIVFVPGLARPQSIPCSGNSMVDIINTYRFGGEKIMKCSKKFIFAVLFCSFVTASAVPGVYAQNDADEFMLEEITVTAQKRDENQQKVAIAMDVISQEEMDRLGWNNVDEILSNVSNVIINTSQDGMRVSLRGLADDGGFNMGVKTSTPTVAVNMDGAYNSNSSAGMNLYDVERVEVLFGPQSTMYASNSPGGIVNVVTAAPKTDKYSANASLEYASYESISANGAVNVPLNEVSALRAAFAWIQRDSFLSSDEKGEESKSARLKALYQPNEDLSLTLTGSYTVSANGGMMGGQIKPFENQDGNYADGTKVDDPWTVDDTESTGPGADAGSGNSSDQDTMNLNLNLAWDTAFGAVTFVPTYMESTSSQNQTTTMPGSSTPSTRHIDVENTQRGGEIRMASPADFFFKWIAGVNYYRSRNERITDFITQEYENGLNLNQNETYAVFGNITYPLTQTLRFTGGYRYSWDEMKSFEDDPSKPQGPNAPDQETFQEYSSPDTKLGFEYDLADNAMLYMDRSTSYRMQSMGQKNSDGESVPPEELISYTVGAKTRFLDNKLQVNVSAYYYDYENKIANQMLSASYSEEAMYLEHAASTGYSDDYFDYNGDDVIGDGVIDGFYNGDGDELVQLREPNSQGWGAFRTYGLDVQTNWIITGKDKMSVSVSYLDAKFDDLTFDYVYDYIWPDESFNGKRKTYSPEWTVNAAYDHNFTLGNGGSLNARMDGQYQSSYVLTWKPAVTADGYRYDYQEGSYIFNTSFVYSNPTGMWSVSAYVKNIFDYAKKTSCMTKEANGQINSVTMMLSNPRTIGAMFSIKF